MLDTCTDRARDLRFSRRRNFKSRSSGSWHRVELS